MIGFLLKKYFFDLWDNLFLILTLNFVFLLFLAVSLFFLPYLPAAQIIALVLVIYVLFVFICNAAVVVKEASDYRQIVLSELFVNIKAAFLPALVFAAVTILLFFICRITIPFYFQMGGIAGFAAAVFSCWICLFIICSIQFYPAVYYRLGRHPLKSIKKCIIIFFDNTGFCLFVLIFNIILTTLILPVPGCHLLFLDEALRLRLLKYDWLDEQKSKLNSGSSEQGLRKTKIPWKELLAEEKEKTGNRTWRSFIFPWKE